MRFLKQGNAYMVSESKSSYKGLKPVYYGDLINMNGSDYHFMPDGYSTLSTEVLDSISKKLKKLNKID